MLHIQFVEMGLSVPEKRVSEGFIPYRAVAAICDPYAANKFRSPYPRRFHMKFGFHLASGFRKEDV